MTTDFILPDIGEGIVECELVEWLVAEGEEIKEDQAVAEVMTDKAMVQIPAMYSGVVEKLYYKKGDIAKVHQPLFAMKPNSTSEPVTTSSNVETPVEPIKSDSNNTITEDFILPDIGEGIVECELVEWLINEGDMVKEDQAVAEVMTDKAMVQIPAMYTGIVTKLYYKKGDIAQVHQPLFAQERQSSGVTITAQTPQSSELKPIENKQQPAQSTAATNTAVKHGNAKALASPAVRRVAKELGVDIHQVPGSGKKGRVYKDDVVQFNQNKGVTNVEVLAHQSNDEDKTVAIKGIQAAMAKQMMNSVATIPHFTYCEEIDLTELISLRQTVKAQYAEQGIKVTMMPFFMKAMSLALNEFPIINSRVNDDCTEMTYINSHNIGMAVDSKIGLIVPNIKNVQNKSLLELAKSLNKLTDDARDGRVTAEDLKQGTITISNIGAIGGTVATPIINKPEVAIVALGKVQKLPRFDVDGNVVSRSIMQVSWSGDHRIIDGATMARFCNLWKQYLEQPSTMLMQMN